MTANEEWVDIDIDVDSDDFEQERLAKVLEKVSEVCAIPAAAARVLELTRSENASVGPVVQALSSDAAMAAEVMRIANSPFFAQTRKVADLQRAVIVIGMQELNMMAGAMAMLAAFAKEGQLSTELHDTAVVSADIARSLCKHYGAPKQSLGFLAGLLCEIGGMACAATDVERYTAIWQSTVGDPQARMEKERRRYGASVEFIGARMLERNQLPAEVVEAVSASLTAPCTMLSKLQRITLFARLAAPLLLRASRETPPPPIERDLAAHALRLEVDDVGEDNLRRICILSLTANGYSAPLGFGPSGTSSEEPASAAPAEDEEDEDESRPQSGAASRPTGRTIDDAPHGPRAAVRMGSLPPRSWLGRLIDKLTGKG